MAKIVLPEPIKGYSTPTVDTAKVVNRNKILEEMVLRMLDEHFKDATYDGRWLAIAKTHFQEGFMAMNRAVFQPKRIEGDLNAEIDDLIYHFKHRI